MNLGDGAGRLAGRAFRLSLALRRLMPARRSRAFGLGEGGIDAVLVVNLDRKPERWRRMRAELGRLRCADGRPLAAIASRMAAIDARDPRETAPTADVDPIYRMRDQLLVEPDVRLASCFDGDEPIRMTRQEVAVARSHVEAWKRISRGSERHVLVLEDDVYFAVGAARSIERAWGEACRRDRSADGPELAYLSYLDAGGSAERADVGRHVFRPVRGLWHLSGYVLSREGAAKLLRSMPVVGPVDLWINGRFAELDVVAMAEPAILQRPDGGSDNAYSILPYLSRAGVVNAARVPESPATVADGPVFAWNAPGPTDPLGMALSMLGYRVRSGRRGLPLSERRTILEGGEPTFGAYVDAVVSEVELAELARARMDLRFVVHAGGGRPASRIAGTGIDRPPLASLPPERTLVLATGSDDQSPWGQLCGFLGRPVPDSPYPVGADRPSALFDAADVLVGQTDAMPAFDASPWILPTAPGQAGRGVAHLGEVGARQRRRTLEASLRRPCPGLRALSDTFPGNLAVFDPACVSHGADGVDLTIEERQGAVRRFRSGALATVDVHLYGRFEIEMRAARGPGLVNGFFLHRARPRQEIDVEVLGDDTRRMLVNVFFNPGDEGADLEFGYRGTPVGVDLGFDASENFHRYAVEWAPDGVIWSVDDRVVHQRSSWDPTPIPHLPMRLHMNLWASSSVQFAGRLRSRGLPAHASFRMLAAFERQPD